MKGVSRRKSGTYDIIGKEVAWPRSAFAKNHEICAIAQIMPEIIPGKVASV